MSCRTRPSTSRLTENFRGPNDLTLVRGRSAAELTFLLSRPHYTATTRPSAVPSSWRTRLDGPISARTMMSEARSGRKFAMGKALGSIDQRGAGTYLVIFRHMRNELEMKVWLYIQKRS